jgi:hypothetical protein
MRQPCIVRALTRSLSSFCGLVLMLPALTAAQGVGTAGAQVLQFIAGSRAPAMSGAYTAADGDIDALFYNPAGIATLRYGAGLSYETYVEEIALGSFGGVVRLGRMTVGLGGVYLNGGEIIEVLPDPDFGGNRGIATDRTFSASEIAARLSLAVPIGERLRVGASAGMVSSSLADESRSAPVFDLGAQYDFSIATVGAALRNIGGSLSGGDLANADLPMEGRLGAAFRFTRADGLGATLHTDLVARLAEGSAGLLVGAEAGWLASADHALGAVARVGYSAAEGAGGLGAVRLGAGLTMTSLALDYTFQNLEFFGAVHRFGLRWAVPR